MDKAKEVYEQMIKEKKKNLDKLAQKETDNGNRILSAVYKELAECQIIKN